MRFIRKGGRVIPIRDSGVNKTQAAVGGAATAWGGYRLASGAKRYSQGIHQAAEGFHAAVSSMKHFGPAAKAMGPVSPYGLAKTQAQAGMKLAKRGAVGMVLGAAFLGGGAAMLSSAFKGRKKNG